MKIYFTCSTAEFSKYKESYFSIREFLVKQNHILTRDWLAKAELRISTGDMKVDDIKKIYMDCMKALDEADLVIIEDTVSNFSTGHQITVALQWQKPTLVLWQGQKHRHFNKMFIHGIESEFLEVAEYSQENMQAVIAKFTNKYENAKQKNRFHLVLSNVERKYLDWVQHKRQTSRTKLIRNSIHHALENDKEYQKYLEGTY